MNSNINNLSNSLVPTKDNTGTSIASQSKTVSTASVALIATTLNNATDMVAWTVMDAGIYVTFDGTAASSSNGHLIASGTSGEWSTATAAAALAIRDDATDARVQFSEFQTR